MNMNNNRSCNFAKRFIIIIIFVMRIKTNPPKTIHKNVLNLCSLLFQVQSKAFCFAFAFHQADATPKHRNTAKQTIADQLPASHQVGC